MISNKAEICMNVEFLASLGKSSTEIYGLLKEVMVMSVYHVGYSRSFNVITSFFLLRVRATEF